MNYALFRKSDLDEEKERLVGFIDVGYAKTSFFIAKIWKNHAEIIYEINERNLGVRDLDLNLYDYYYNSFNSKNNVDLGESPKSSYRLFTALEKLRKHLTSNIEAGLNIECLYQDYDLFENLKRDRFEQLNSSVFQKFREFLQKVIKDIKKSKIDFSKVHSVERIGGGSRIPLIESIIMEELKLSSVSKTLDANESISRGCAIQSAMLSPRYHVSKFKIAERSHYPIKIKLKYE